MAIRAYAQKAVHVLLRQKQGKTTLFHSNNNDANNNNNNILL